MRASSRRSARLRAACRAPRRCPRWAGQLLSDRTALLFQMQSYAACSDPVIQQSVREGYGEIVKEVTRLSGAEPEEIWQFFSHGMLLNVIASLDLGAIADSDEWACAWSQPVELIRMTR